MAYSDELEKRMDAIALGWVGITKKSMFGGIGYLMSGNMAFGIWRDSLVVRCGKDLYENCLCEDQISPFDITGRAMSGWVMVSSLGIQTSVQFEKAGCKRL
jgi:hypothetical protein